MSFFYCFQNLLLLSTLLSTGFCGDEFVTVPTQAGLIQGKRIDLGHNKKSLYNGKADVFLGIPYAQPPIRERRFAPPQDTGSYEGSVYNATFYKSLCLQPNVKDSSEDCLYLNVFCQNAVNYSLLSAVMVFIDGNSQLSEGGVGQDQEKGIVKNLVARNVVVVTVQYRLGPLGFFATPNDNGQIPPNLGMLDQHKALQWVQRNIISFGGDPNKVTLVGHDGGACAVAAHTYSQMSQGLFQQAILQSGSINSCYTEDRNYAGVDPTANTNPPTTLQYDQGLAYSPLGSNSPSSTQASVTASPLPPNQQISNPSQLLATQLCNVTADQWRSGQLNGLKECLHNYTVDVFVKTDGIHTATWLIVRDNMVLNAPLSELAKRRPPIPLIIGTVQDEDADYAFKLVNTAAANNGTESDAFNNWFVDFARRNRVNGSTAQEIKNVIAQNYNISDGQSGNSISHSPFQSGQYQSRTSEATTLANTAFTPSSQFSNNVGYQPQRDFPQMQQSLLDSKGRLDSTAVVHALSVITNVSSDAGTVSQVVTEVDSWIQGGSRFVHVYRFEHRTKLGTPAAYNMLKGYEPIPKGQDKLFLFMSESVWSKQNPSTEDKKMADAMGQRWTDFAKQGSVQGWQPVQQPQATAISQPSRASSNTPYCSLTTVPSMQMGYGAQARQVFNDQVYPIVQESRRSTNGQGRFGNGERPVGTPSLQVTNHGSGASSWSMSFNLDNFRFGRK